MQNVLDFLAELKNNNTREWFEQNRDKYESAKAEFETFTSKLIDELSTFDLTLKGITLKECTYRIYRDVRFSKDKEPYKTHMGAYICRGGKKSGYAGYYFHIEPKGDNFLGSSMLCAGSYCPEPKVLKSIREEIYDNTTDFLNTLSFAKGFVLESNQMLKRPPKGFEPTFECIEYLKYKNYVLCKEINDINADNLLMECVNEFKTTQPFLDTLNRAIQFSYEED